MPHVIFTAPSYLVLEAVWAAVPEAVPAAALYGDSQRIWKQYKSNLEAMAEAMPEARQGCTQMTFSATECAFWNLKSEKNSKAELAQKYPVSQGKIIFNWNIFLIDCMIKDIKTV